MYATRMEDGEDLQNHLDKLTNLLRRITDMGEQISETTRIGIILSSQPLSWNNLVTTLSSSAKKKEDLTMAIVISNLSDEEIRGKIHTEFKEGKGTQNCII